MSVSERSKAIYHSQTAKNSSKRMEGIEDHLKGISIGKYTCAMYISYQIPNVSTSIANVVIKWYMGGEGESECDGKKT